MFYTYVFNFLGLWIFLYVLWRKLKDDYLPSQVFTLGIFMSVGIALFAFLAHEFLPVYWFWLSFSGAALGLLLGIIRFKLRFFESLEATTAALVPWLSFVFLADSIKNLSWFSFAMFIFLTLLTVVYIFVSRSYRNFSWYRSGRVGVAALIVLGVFFLVRAVVAQVFPFVLSFAGKGESILSAVVSFIIFLVVFNLSRQI